MITLLKNLTDHQIATACWIAYLIIWIVLFIYARRWCLKKEKEVSSMKDNTVTFITHDDTPGRYTCIDYSENPWHEANWN